MSYSSWHVGMRVVFIGGSTHVRTRHYLFGIVKRHLVTQMLRVGDVFTVTGIHVGPPQADRQGGGRHPHRARPRPSPRPLPSQLLPPGPDPQDLHRNLHRDAQPQPGARAHMIASISFLPPFQSPPALAAGFCGQARPKLNQTVSLSAVLGDRGEVARRFAVFAGGRASDQDARRDRADRLERFDLQAHALPMFAMRGTTPRLKGWRTSVPTSARSDTQGCGDRTAELFDLAGLAGWLRQRFPTSTGYHVEAATGIPAATTENWFQRRSRPSVEHFLILCSVFGPSLLRATLRRSPDWIDRAVQVERAVEIDQEILRLTAEKASLPARAATNTG